MSALPPKSGQQKRTAKADSNEIVSICPLCAIISHTQQLGHPASSFAAFARYDWGASIRGEGMNSWLRLLAILASLILIGSPAAAKYSFPSRLDALSKEGRIDVVKRPNMPDSGDQPTLVIDDLTFKYDPDVWVRCHP